MEEVAVVLEEAIIRLTVCLLTRLSNNNNNTVDSRYLEFQGTHCEISVPRHIRVERVRKTIN